MPLQDYIPSRKTAVVPMSDDEKTRYLLSNPTLLKSYGNDAASAFVNTLRDDALDPVVRHDRIIEQRQSLSAIVEELDRVIAACDQKTETKLIDDARFNKENIETLVSMSDTLAQIDVTNAMTESVDDVVDVINDPMKKLVLVADQSPVYPETRGEKNEHLAVMLYDENAVPHARRMSFLIAAIMVVITLVGMVFTPPLVAFLIVAACVAAGVFYAVSASHAAKEVVSIPQKKLLAFVKHCSRQQSYDQVRKYLDMPADFPQRSVMLHNDFIRDWIEKAAPVLDVIEMDDITTYTSKSETNEHRALKKLASEFDSALMKNNRIYQSELRAKAEAERKSALKKMEEDKRLKNFTDKQQRVLSNYLGENNHKGQNS